MLVALVVQVAGLLVVAPGLVETRGLEVLRRRSLVAEELDESPYSVVGLSDVEGLFRALRIQQELLAGWSRFSLQNCATRFALSTE